MDIKARMPGQIVSVLVKEGDKVEYRQQLAVMEAMKMEQYILSTTGGSVKEIKVAPGEKVKSGQLLFVIG